MIAFNQFAIAISLIIIAVTLIIGIILIAANTAKINKNLTKNNQLLETVNRPFLTISLHKDKLAVKNTGKTQATIDLLSIDDVEIADFSGLVINPKQEVIVKIEESGNLTVEYHGETKSYRDKISAI
ncbi:hypothetical protein [Companilactobacillus kedongensis]|uniref:hypothetical protein n=1 Tax=Companilactobacillus kedongensis TaxID=2486004 RepID=UPI000F7A159F|nr:hypothetical protein [Companilactobacillus kedongensis]